MTCAHGLADSDSENLGSNPSSPASEIVDPPHLSGADKSDKADKPRTSGRTKVGTVKQRPGRKPNIGSPNARGVVYFITCGFWTGSGPTCANERKCPIKIGFASNLQSRIKYLQTALPWPIKVLYALPGTRHTEQTIQGRFHRYRMRGDWFEPAKPIWDYIAELKRATPQPPKSDDEPITVNAPWLSDRERRRLGIDYEDDSPPAPAGARIGLRCPYTESGKACSLPYAAQGLFCDNCPALDGPAGARIGLGVRP